MFYTDKLIVACDCDIVINELVQDVVTIKCALTDIVQRQCCIETPYRKAIQTVADQQTITTIKTLGARTT